MIKFFRKIRQRLLEENRFSKYLLYAIGEILLVVAGILIALQINNANEARKLESLKEVYLERMINDLKQDTISIHSVIKELNTSQDAIISFVKQLDSSELSSGFQLATEEYLSKGWIISEFISTNNTYIDLSQTGNMKTINNSELIEKILEYYGYVQIIENYNTTNKNWIIPTDIEVATKTTAFELDPSTKILFTHKNRNTAFRSIKENQALMERNAAGHFWMNQSLIQNLEALKGVAKNLLIDLQQQL